MLLFLFLLPWQTRLIWHEGKLNGGHWEYGTLSFFVVEILLWLVVVFFVADKFRKKEFWQKILSKEHWQTHKYNFLIGLLIIFGLFLPTLFSLNFQISYQHFLWVLGGMCVGMIIIETQNFVSVYYYIMALWAGGVLQGLLAIWQFFSQQIYHLPFSGVASQSSFNLGAGVIESGGERWLRAYGSFGGPNPLGIYLAVCLVLGLFLYLKKTWNYRDAKSCVSTCITIGQLIILSGLLLSFSRGAWLAAGMGVVALIVIIMNAQTQNIASLLKKIFKHLFYYLLIILCFLIFLHPLFFARFNLQNRLEIKSIQERANQYSEAITIFKQRPWLGVGPGMYTYAMYKDNPNLNSWDYQPIHNMYILILAEVGVFGSLVYLFIWGWLVRRIWRSNFMFVPVVVTLLVAGLFEHWQWSLFSGVVMWWVIFGLSLKEPE